MQQPAASPSASSPSPAPSFAGLLAAFAAPGQKRPPARDLDGLEDDVATLSYERALRAHTRYRTPVYSDPAPREPSRQAQLSIVEVAPPDELPAVEAAPEEGLPREALPDQALPDVSTEAIPEAAPAMAQAQDAGRKSAKITFWLSNAECAQLRSRAAEAGLTVSAYMRHCTVEAESLRAEVKETLAQLRSEAAQQSQAAEPPAGRSLLGQLQRLWHGRDGKQAMRA